MLFPGRCQRPTVAGGPRRLRSRAYRQRRLLRLHSLGQRPAGARGRRYQWKRNFGCPLMATVHAFVRAYSIEPEMALMPASLLTDRQEDPRMYYRGDGSTDSQLAPAMLMATLNYQLFRSTPAAKYATMFLGCYDAKARALTYCNAGHLPPLIAAGHGRGLPPGRSTAPWSVSSTALPMIESTLGMQTGGYFCRVQ